MELMIDRRQILVLGGARSGKSAYAEALAERHDGPRIYIATAEPRDGEMRARIDHHIERRGSDWQSVEEPIALAAAIGKYASPDRFLLIDCITIWLSNLMERQADVGDAVDTLMQTLGETAGAIVLVSNEVGMGIVPENALARQFRDVAGITNQKIAAHCSSVVFVAAGLPMILKGKDPTKPR